MMKCVLNFKIPISQSEFYSVIRFAVCLPVTLTNRVILLKLLLNLNVKYYCWQSCKILYTIHRKLGHRINFIYFINKAYICVQSILCRLFSYSSKYNILIVHKYTYKNLRSVRELYIFGNTIIYFELGYLRNSKNIYIFMTVLRQF